MNEVKLNEEEIAILKAIFSKLAIRSRTGDIGIIHGMDRFVSTQVVLKKSNREYFASIASKIGISAVREV